MSVPFNENDIEATLQSFDGMQQATVPPFFFTRLQARIDKQSAEKGFWNYLSRPIVTVITVSVLLVLNVGVVSLFLQSEKQTTEKVTSDRENFAQEFGLNSTSSYYDKTVK
jgi:ABC-type uncharacterized transport system permease subunit